MKLYIRKSSGKSQLQEQLDREKASNAPATAIEELPLEQHEGSGKRPLLGKPSKSVFHVDLMGGWVKP